MNARLDSDARHNVSERQDIILPGIVTAAASGSSFDISGSGVGTRALNRGGRTFSEAGASAFWPLWPALSWLESLPVQEAPAVATMEEGAARGGKEKSLWVSPTGKRYQPFRRSAATSFA
ncbi:MAG: hypothetical protein PHD01_03865 [Geobacteraceae bacterium]|nr:hypothetical protein [Geobacteraceae bacterium]